MAKLNMAYLSSLKNQQNSCRPDLPVSPSRVLNRVSRLSWQDWTWHKKPETNGCRPTCRCHHLGYSRVSRHVLARLNIACFIITSITAIVLLAGVTISGTPCPRHFTVPFWFGSTYNNILSRPEQVPPPILRPALPMVTTRRRLCQRLYVASSVLTQRHS